MDHDPVNKPKHYNNHPSGVQCIEMTQHMSFNLGNAFKYIFRCDDKCDLIEDLKKAAWYIGREIKLRDDSLLQPGCILKKFNYNPDCTRIVAVLDSEPDKDKENILYDLWQAELHGWVYLRRTLRILEDYIERRENALTSPQP